MQLSWVAADSIHTMQHCVPCLQKRREGNTSLVQAIAASMEDVSKHSRAAVDHAEDETRLDCHLPEHLRTDQYAPTRDDSCT